MIKKNINFAVFCVFYVVLL